LSNQLTRGQHVHSPRANFWTFPLYFLAENISVPATVLDFPSCHKAEQELGVREFAVIDEILLKNAERARDLLRKMEHHGKNYNFWVFASAEVLTQVGVDFLVRLGVRLDYAGCAGSRRAVICDCARRV